MQELDNLELRYAIIKQLVKLRNSYNLSQTQLAKKIGTTQSVISRIENGIAYNIERERKKFCVSYH